MPAVRILDLFQLALDPKLHQLVVFVGMVDLDVSGKAGKRLVGVEPMPHLRVVQAQNRQRM